ncbi:para-aminobenzoate synthase, (PABA) [Coemansia sp. Benny D115]|nr:para-aminobenzoate synthase, (PABA) [Coemansia sp. Benny D115]
MVIRNDQYPWPTVRDQILPFIDNVIISPGPGNPTRKEDFGICGELIRACGTLDDEKTRPVLGVCLGHQGIAAAFGGKVKRCAVPVHGQTSKVTVDRNSSGCLPHLFEGIPDLFSVVRYHSLAVSNEPGEFPSNLQVLARAAGTVKAFVDGQVIDVPANEIMALRHRERALYGVQFHPESICSEYGERLLRNFHSITRAIRNGIQGAPAAGSDSICRFGGIPPEIQAMSLQAVDNRVWRVDTPLDSHANSKMGVVVKSVDLDVGGGMDVGGSLFSFLYGDDPMPLWLDSAKHGDTHSAMSIMASAATPGSATVRYSVESRRIKVVSFANKGGSVTCTELMSATLPVSSAGRAVSFWTWIQGIVDRTRAGCDGLLASPAFQGGWMGYFGYEMKDECMGQEIQAATGDGACCTRQTDGGNGCDRMPDAQLSFVDRCVVVDHQRTPPRAYVLALVSAKDATCGCKGRCPHKRQHQAHPDSLDEQASWLQGLGFESGTLAERWVDTQIERIESWKRHSGTGQENAFTKACASPVTSVAAQGSVQPMLSRDDYLVAIATSKELISQGESYEICLTNQFRVHLPTEESAVRTSAEIQHLYACMRRRNPAPYGALLWYADIQAGVASCSPERFLRVIDSVSESTGEIGDIGERWAEMKPIKGTRRRDPQPPAKDLAGFEQWAAEDRRRALALQSDAKERAENLMIVDLIRHDLSWIAHEGRVQVPALMAIESYASVHQMVTTVRAQLSPKVGDVAALAHCFPPGSMTGAPKLRTTQIISALEPEPRGVYSGCLGYFSACGRRSDWSVVIRTAVVDQRGTRLSVGAGGALTILSDASEEWDEVETKLQAALAGIQSFICERAAELKA